MSFRLSILLALLVAAATLHAELPDPDEWPLENGYDTPLLYLHALANYAYDPSAQYEWERRQYAGNALRANSGSVSSDELLTEVELNLNEPLNERWRFFGQFRRTGFRRRPVRQDQLLLGLERLFAARSAVYLGVNPEYSKEFLDIEGGWARYSDNREQYLRIGLRAIDLNWESKNKRGGLQERRALKLNWAIRQSLGQRLWLYSKGLAGQGFERHFPDAAKSPQQSRHDRNENRAQLRLTRIGGDASRSLWSLMIEWYAFEERRQFRQPGFDYDYENRQLNAGAEHVRMLGERHRLRLLAQLVEQSAKSRGFREHDYDRRELLAGAFYEYLWPNSGLTIAYAAGRPDIVYEALDAAERFAQQDYTDKLIVGWRYRFSASAEIRASLSQEVSERGFGGGAIQFQMTF